MTLGSLFDGIGGFPVAALLNGITPVWASEIEAAPVSITKRHLPRMEYLGDITKINGAEIEPVDIITFGSPCQDLSLAGNRKGLAGARSGLFMEAVRIIKEIRNKTHGKYPAFAVWENVVGAFSYKSFGEYKEDNTGKSLLSCDDITTGDLITADYKVRRLTPTECERPMGFPDGWTEYGHDGKKISDSARYRALGNSVAIPCVLRVLQGVKEAVQ